MNRSEIVSLLQKNIEELVLITNGFAQMETYPAAILDLARRKNTDIRVYIEMLAGGGVEVQEKAQAQAQAQVEEKTQAQAQVEVKEVLREDIQEEVQEEAEKPVEEAEAGVKADVDVEADAETDLDVDVDTDIDAEVEAGAGVETEAGVDVKTEPEAELNEVVPEETDIFHASVDEVQEEITEKTTIGIEIIHPVENDDPDEEDDAADEKKAATESQKPITLGEKLSGNHVSRNDILQKPVNGAVHSSISNLKISDIRQAISLGDRFRFQRELFRNNGEEMNKMLSYLNMLATFEEAVAFLFSKYGWDEENPAVNDFLQIIKRKF